MRDESRIPMVYLANIVLAQAVLHLGPPREEGLGLGKGTAGLLAQLL